MRDTFRGGVHPKEHKDLSRKAALRVFDAKGEMVFPLAQHIGKPAKAIVKKGDPVLVGQRIAEADGFVSANVICSCSGTVKAVEKRRTISGAMQECVVVDNDGQLLGVLTGFTRKGKNHTTAESGYRFYVRFWNAIYPLRFVWFRIKRGLRAIAEKLGLIPVLKKLLGRK